MEIPWREIELACVAGMDYAEAAVKFDVKVGTIRKRAIRHNWPTPARIGARAKELALKGGGGEGVIEAAARTLVERGEKHREHVFTQSHEAIKKSKVKPPRNWKDYEIADKVARRAAGLDTAENVQQVLLQINEATDEEIKPAKASTVETAVVDQPS